ncbi:MAG: putative sulfate exporter family transporter [Planctomycetes bacterium]|nr:putative sulfate exporter family transporter [Planctomycetota bacterium]
MPYRVPFALWRRFGPGLSVCALIAAAAAFVAEHHGGPPFLYALLFGIALHFLVDDERASPGIELASRFVLRLGVGLLGARITAAQIVGLGWLPALLIIAVVALTITAGALAARRLRQPLTDGLLTGGAVAICGASAALAIAALLPRNERNRKFTLLTVVGVTALSTAAMIVYPAIVRALDLDARAAGIFLGGTIHDVAQVMGAGYMISPATGDVAAVVKLLRVSLLVPVVLVLSLLLRRNGTSPTTARPPLLPWFLLLFCALVAANSLHWVPAAAGTALGTLSRACLLTAIAALGIKTSFGDLRSLGWIPIALLVGETLLLAGVVLLGVWF